MTSSLDTDLSPAALANAAYTNAIAIAIAQRERQDNDKHPRVSIDGPENNNIYHPPVDGTVGGDDVTPRPTKLFKSASSANNFSSTNRQCTELDDASSTRIADLWTINNNDNSSNAINNFLDDIDAKLETTLNILHGAVDAHTQTGIKEYHEHDVTNRQLVQAREMADVRGREVNRLHAIDEQSRASLSVGAVALVLNDCLVQCSTI
eukprot:scaffold276_cov200-Alexandrium_tamarense.AAC.5